MNEPTITINGKTLTENEAMTVRVAIESLSMELRANGCGDDEHGKLMSATYWKAIHELRHAMYRTDSPPLLGAVLAASTIHNARKSENDT